MHVVHRLQQWDSITVMNDQMIGPFTHYPTLLAKAFGMRDYLVTSMWPGCCIRGFFIAFARPMIGTDKWQRYWRQAAFPCAKIGPMVVGEGAFGKPPLVWRDECVTATHQVLGKGMPLQQQMQSHSPFIYRAGLEQAFGHNRTAIHSWLHSFNATLQLETCAF